ncbi:MAG: aminotransferase class V-fold PLP-dependent enzyme, partial [Promethearchaeota archaeon]
YWKDLNLIRKLISQLINAKPEEIAFLINTSSGTNLIARLMNNGEILYPKDEFPASIHIFKRLGFICKKINPQPNNCYSIEDFKKSINNTTKILIQSHVQYLTGFRQDLKKFGDFCTDNNLINIINATQSFGAFNIDVKKQNIDILACSALKWACCGYGIGILYLKQELLKEDMLPFTSWLSTEDPFLMDNENLNLILEARSMDGLGGTPNFPALLTLKGFYELLKEIGKGNIQEGVNQISKRILYLTNEFLTRIKELNLKIITPTSIKYRSGIITVENDKAETIYYNLLKNHIYISLRNQPNNTKKTLLRFSFHYYNNLNDIEKTIKILKKLV